MNQIAILVHVYVGVHCGAKPNLAATCVGSHPRYCVGASAGDSYKCCPSGVISPLKVIDDCSYRNNNVGVCANPATTSCADGSFLATFTTSGGPTGVGTYCEDGEEDATGTLQCCTSGKTKAKPKATPCRLATARTRRCTTARAAHPGARTFLVARA